MFRMRVEWNCVFCYGGDSVERRRLANEEKITTCLWLVPSVFSGENEARSSVKSGHVEGVGVRFLEHVE